MGDRSAHRAPLAVATVALGLAILLAVHEVSEFRSPDHDELHREREREARRADSGERDATATTGSTVPPRSDRWSLRAAFAGVKFADELQIEQEQSTANAPGRRFESDFINIASGLRRTISPGGCECPSATIWLVGGSAAFGFGQRDDYTVASWLVRAAASEGLSLTVENMAVPGWRIADEVDAVRKRLETTEDVPDMVVFFDGYNDAFAAVVAAVATGRIPEPSAVVPPEFQTEFERQLDAGDEVAARSLERVGGPDAVADSVVKGFRGQMAKIEGLLQSEGVASVFYFQPDAFEGAIQATDMQQLYPERSTPGNLALFRQLIDRVAVTLEDDGVVNLREVVADHPSPLFFDSVHMNETGARLVADAIYRDLAPRIRAVAGESSA